MDESTQPDGRLPGGRAGEQGPLTARQAEVLGLLAAGSGTAEIAARLGVSPDEVREQVWAATATLGASNWIHALILAIRAGLIEPPA